MDFPNYEHQFVDIHIGYEESIEFEDDCYTAPIIGYLLPDTDIQLTRY
jgi:hypothetical protein